jgi:F-type H+-transporting ATPase subunit c
MRKFVMLMFVMIIASVIAVPAFAQTTNGNAASTTNWVALTAGFAIALAAGLAAQGQGKVAAAACEALGRNPAARAGIQLAMLLGLAFIESLVLFTFVMIFLKVQ